MTTVEKFQEFAAHKMYIFSSTFHETFNAVQNIVFGRKEVKDDGVHNGTSEGNGNGGN